MIGMRRKLWTSEVTWSMRRLRKRDQIWSSIRYRCSIGLPSTDDPLIGEKVANFEYSKSDQKEKLFPADQEKFGRGEDQHPWEVNFNVKQPLTFF